MKQNSLCIKFDSFEILLHEKDISRGRIFLQVLDTLRTRT